MAAKTPPKGLQDRMERNIWALLIVLAIVLSIAGIVEIVPLFYLKDTMEYNKFPQIVWSKAGQEPIVAVVDGKQTWNWKTGDGVRPYTALELAGRDIYQREGCYVCHSQMVRPFRDEKERFGLLKPFYDCIACQACATHCPIQIEMTELVEGVPRKPSKPGRTTPRKGKSGGTQKA